MTFKAILQALQGGKGGLKFIDVTTRAGEPESEPKRPEPHDLVGATLFFLQEPKREPEHFKKLEWTRN